MTYRDFVRWEADLLQEEEAQLAAFWRTQLGDEPPILHLPVDLTADGYLGKTIDFAFASDQVTQLRAFAQSQQITFFTLLLAAYQVAPGALQRTRALFYHLAHVPCGIYLVGHTPLVI